MFSDDSAPISDGVEMEYWAVVHTFVTWWGQNHLDLNVDFRRTRKPATPFSIQGVDMEIMDDYKYFGVHTDNKLDWV